MHKRMIALACAAVLAASAGAALAQHGGGGGGRGGGNSGGGGGWHGGGWHGWRGYGFAIGAPLWYWGAWPYYYPYYDSYYYPAGYSATYTAPYPASYPSNSGSNAWYVDTPPGAAQSYPESSAPAASPQGAVRPPPPQTYQYYCPDAGYYPAVATCAKGWLRVIPDAPPK